MPPAEDRQAEAGPRAAPGAPPQGPPARAAAMPRPLETVFRAPGSAPSQSFATPGGAALSQERGAEQGDGQGGLVAVVFDKDRFFRQFQVLLLGQQGFRVLAPEDPGEFTMDYLAQAKPDLLVTEILLPGADGLELVRTVKDHPVLQRARVVVFSVLSAEARALACGADRFVQKPLMRDDFLEVIHEVAQDVRKDPSESP